MKVAVIGVGIMGRWLAQFAKDNLGDVTLTDINRRKAGRIATELKVKSGSMDDAVADADLVLVAVPISKTPEVVKGLASEVRKDALIADVSSVKEDIVETMKEIGGEMELASIHPLFGPGATTVKGKDFLVVPVRTGKVYRKLKKVLTDLGVRVTELKAVEHDKLMAVVQCLTHFTLISYLTTLETLKEFEKIGDVRTPMFESLKNLSKVVLAGNPEVFGELQVHNRYARIVRTRVLESCRALDTVFDAKNAKNMEHVFNSVLNMFSPGEVQKAYAELYGRFEEGEK